MKQPSWTIQNRSHTCLKAFLNSISRTNVDIELAPRHQRWTKTLQLHTFCLYYYRRTLARGLLILKYWGFETAQLSRKEAGADGQGKKTMLWTNQDTCEQTWFLPTRRRNTSRRVHRGIGSLDQLGVWGGVAQPWFDQYTQILIYLLVWVSIFSHLKEQH